MEQLEKISLNILGVCVLRDIFALHENDGGYEIRKYVNQFAPLYALESGADVDESAFQQTDCSKLVPNFTKRCMYLDVTKQSFQWIQSQMSDYLLIDTALTRNDYFVLENGIHCYGIYRSVHEIMSKKHIFPAISGIKKFNDFSAEELEERLHKYADKILELYPPEKIILFQINNALIQYDNRTGKTESFVQTDRYRQQNAWINLSFEILRKKLNGCHVVYMPDHVIGDTHHRLGAAPMHYTQELYDYGLKAVDLICKGGLSQKDEIYELEKLRREYNSLYAERYADSLENAVVSLSQEYKKTKDVKERLLKYTNYFQEVLRTGSSVSAFCKEKQLKTVGLYGLSKVAEYFAADLLANGCSIACLIENTTSKHLSTVFPIGAEQIKILPRNVVSYPEMDAIFITDMMATDKIVKKLQSLTSVPIYTAHDIIRK